MAIDLEVAREAMNEIFAKLQDATEHARRLADRVQIRANMLTKFSGADDLEKILCLVDEANAAMSTVKSLQRQTRSAIYHFECATAELKADADHFVPMPVPRGHMAQHTATKGSESADVNKSLFETALARRFSER